MKFFVYLFNILIFFIFNVFAIQVTTLDVKNGINSTDKTLNLQGWVLNILKTINEYIWYIAIVLVLALFVYMGIVLMKSEWNEEDMKKIKNIFKSMWLAIFVIILAAAIIKAVVTLSFK